MSKIVLANRVYVPVHLVPEQRIEELYEQHCFVQTTCRNCKIFKEGLRPSQQCFTCTPDTPGSWNGYSGHLIQWKRVTVKGREYYSLPAGNLYEIEKELGLNLSQALDLRCRKPMDIKLTFTGKLYTGREVVGGKKMANQIGLIKSFWRTKHKSGVIEAPMRSGKTVLGAFLCCAFGLKTIILAHETILLRQFEAEFRKMTDVNRQERLTGRRLLVVAEKEKDLKSNSEVLLINYQKLISEIGIKRLLHYIQKRYGVLLTDEIHRVGTQHYEDVVSRLDPLYRVGFTATPERRDGKEAVFRRALGPVVLKAKVDTLKPTVHVVYTPYSQKREYQGRAGYVKTNGWLSEQENRNIDIIKQVFQDLRTNPKHVIVIPCTKVVHAKTLVAMINRQARFNYEKRGEKWQDDLAVMLWRESDKKTVISNVSNYNHRVLVAIQKFVREGTNIPCLTHFYGIFPQNNFVATKQGTGRILTPMDGKPDPAIRLWVDPISICISCFKNTYRDSLIPLGYKIAPESRDTIDLLMRLERDKKTRKWIDPKESATGDNWSSMW